MYAQQTSALQTDLDISSILNLMLPVMIVVMMMKMMSTAVSGVGGTSPKKELQPS